MPHRTTATPLKKAIISATLTALAGFGAMNIFHLITPETGQRDLYTFRSATIGDALFLPMTAAGLTLLITQRDKLHPILRIGLPVAGALGGIALMASWLADPNPDLNWTMPQPHTLNAAGWYHAAFLTLSVTVASWAYGRALLAPRTTPHNQTIERLGWTLTGIGTAGFAALLLIDNLPILNTRAATATMISSTLTIVALTTLAITKKHWNRRER